MTFADITLAVFTFRNSVRLVGYIPQIAKAVRDQSGAEDIALGTWGATFKRAVGWVGLVCAPLFILARMRQLTRTLGGLTNDFR